MTKRIPSVQPAKTPQLKPDSKEFATTDPKPAATPTFKELGGTNHIAFNRMLIKQAIASYPTAGAGQADNAGFDAMALGLAAIAPRDAHEGMIAAQMLGLHNATMECLKRGAFEGQTFEGREMNLSQAAKLSRSYALLMDALGRHRGGGTQKIIVERVTVNAGGQAIVGNIEHVREGVPTNKEEQPHAKQLAYAPVPPLLGLDTAVNPLPVARDDKRPVPHARRQLDGSAER